MGVVSSSCCHKQAQLSFMDKIMNVAVGNLLPLGTIGRESATAEGNLEALRVCREALVNMSKPQYDGAVKDLWKVAEEMLPRPKDAAQSEGPVRVVVHSPISGGANLPLVLYAHAGGMVMSICTEGAGAELFKDIATKQPELKFCWASVDYRLAPEAKFPKAIDDMVHAYMALQDPSIAQRHGYDPARIGLGGISAGGLVAGHATLRLIATSPPPAFVGLVCAMADPGMKMESHKHFADLPICPGSWIRWSWQALLSEDAEQEPSEQRKKEASLLLADWSPCKGLPAVNVVASYDVFADEDLALTKAMATAGMNVEEVVGAGSHCLGPNVDAEAKEKHLSWWCRTLSAAGGK